MSAVALGVGRGSPMVSNSADWLLRDEFITDLAAGSVNGTAAEPGPGTRTVVDTESKIAVLGGELVFSGGKASHAYGDPVIGLGTVSRTPGRTGIFNLRLPATTGFVRFGFNSSYSTAAPTEAIVLLISAAIALYTSAAAYVIVGAAAATTYSVAFALRSSGVMLLIKGGAFAQWTLLYATDYSNSATLYSLISNHSYQLASGYIRVPDRLWLPTPLVSDGFGSAFGTSDGLGHAEGVAGGIGAGGSGVTWSNGGATWSVSGGKAINTPVPGSELVTNGDMETGDPPSSWGFVKATADGVADERTGGAGAQSLQITATDTGEPYASQAPVTFAVGDWVRLAGWVKQSAGNTGAKLRIRNNTNGGSFNTSVVTGSTWTYVAVTARMAYTGNTVWCMLTNSASISDVGHFDDVSLVMLTFSELLSLSNLSVADVFAGVALIRSNTAVQAGLALSWDSASSPANGVIVYVSGTAIKVDKCVAGVWTQVSSTAYTYSAGARLIVAKSGSEYRVYYNNALVGAANTIANAGIITNTYHGLFSTDASNTLDDFTCYATGSGGEYAELDKWS